MSFRVSMCGWMMSLAMSGLAGIAGAQNAGDLVAETAKQEIAQKKVDEADELMAKGQYTEACRLYDLADELVPELRTEAALVECLAKLGQYADAYRRMEAVAKKVPENESAARDWANQQAEKYRQLAPCILIDVRAEERRIWDLEVDLDGQSVPRNSWNTDCYPVNLSKHTVRIRAPRRGWAPQTETTLIPEKRYTVTINPPISKEPDPPPPKAGENEKMSPWLFVVPTGIFAAAGLGFLAFMDHDPNDSTREVFAATCLGAGGGALISGISIYATATPTVQQAAIRPGFSNVGFGLQGRF